MIITERGKAQEITKILQCTGNDCAAKQIGYWSHYVGRDAMNIKGLGGNQFLDLMEFGILHNLSDLHTKVVPPKDRIISSEGWRETSYNALDRAIETSKDVKISAFHRKRHRSSSCYLMSEDTYFLIAIGGIYC